MISAIVLAAGESRRMKVLGGKQLLPLGSSTILETTIDCVTASQIDETLVVLGSRAAEISQRIASKPVKLIINSLYLSGISTSIVAGISAADPKAEAYLLVLGDQPFVPYQVIDRLLKEFENCKQSIIIPSFAGRRGHPLIFAARFQKQLLSLTGDVGARGIIASHEANVVEVPVESAGILLDIDTQEEYSKHVVDQG
jgi:molybdenum cofactor cytidylyltransferase